VTGHRGEERVPQTFHNTDEGCKAALVLDAEPENAHRLRDAKLPTAHPGAKRYPCSVRAVALGDEAVA
jgi:hypothetical protein